MHFDTPPFPREAIRAAVQQEPQRTAMRKRTVLATLVAGFSLAAIAAAADIAIQSHIQFTPSGGLFVSSHMTKRNISSNTEIQEAATHLNFHAVLPAGLPLGAKPIRLELGSDMMVVTYDLPGTSQASPRQAWIFLAKRGVMGREPLKRAHRFHPGEYNSLEFWPIDDEEVIVVSNGLTDAAFHAIRQAMISER